MFPLAGTEYMPVCFLSFWLERCIREYEEEEEGITVSDILKSLQNGASA